MKIVNEVTLKSCGANAGSAEWLEIRKILHRCIQKIHWPENSKKFVIYPESGKKSGMGNGVKPIKEGLMTLLKVQGWQMESKVSAEGRVLGRFDASYQASFGQCVVEWETGNISSSHRSLNKMSMLLSCGAIATGTLIVPSREFYKYLTIAWEISKSLSLT